MAIGWGAHLGCGPSQAKVRSAAMSSANTLLFVKIKLQLSPDWPVRGQFNFIFSTATARCPCGLTIYNVVDRSCKQHVHLHHATTDAQRHVLFVFGSWRQSHSLRTCASLAHAYVPVVDFFRLFNFGHSGHWMGSTPRVWTVASKGPLCGHVVCQHIAFC